MASNTNIQVANLDFGNIKQNFINYLQSQDTFKDYNFTGSALSTLLDVLAYNTQYNAFYLNMVANEMFLDSALQRSSVISHAKLLNYVPQSPIGAVALINVNFTGISTTTFTIPQYTNFLSEAIDGINYNYVTTDLVSTSVVGGVASFAGVELKQGSLATYTFVVDSTTNPETLFEIPDANLDTTTMVVSVQQSSTNTSSQVYNPTTDYLSLGSTDTVYFLQEAIDGNYQIYFGDGAIGQQLSDGNIVTVTYISTAGSAGGLANNFVLMDNLGNYSSVTVNPMQQATQGTDKESIQSIKFQAPKAFSAQGRAVTKNDYITLLQQNTLGIQFDAVSVWGGEENNPPIYGQVFVSLKPKGAYDLTDTQKNLIISQVLEPISVVTIEPTIIDPDYVYLQIAANVLYQQSQTTLNPGTMQAAVSNAVYNYSTTNLNTFNATFSSYELLSAINAVDSSIVSSDFTLAMQKKFYPTFNAAITYNFYYNVPIKRGTYGSTITSSPGFTIVDPNNAQNTIDNIFLAEVPSSTSNIASISIVNSGYNFTAVPTVVINGDGTGATAVATMINGYITNITITNPGAGYTSASAYIVNAAGDTSGTGASLNVVLNNEFGSLKAYYNDPVKGQVVVGSNVGTIDYVNGVITLNNFNIVDIPDSPLGELAIAAQPTTTIIPSTYNRIVTIDPYDSTAVTVTATAKRN
jgi:hypothetical protein